jgi:hypothetical protein
MKKIILIVVLIFSMTSCASFMAGPYPDDPGLNLLYGTYCASLIANPPQTRYYYPLISPPYNYLSNSYVPPSIWAGWSPLQRSLWIESAREIDLQNYKRELERIKENLIYDLRQEIERAKEEDKPGWSVPRI